MILVSILLPFLVQDVMTLPPSADLAAAQAKASAAHKLFLDKSRGAQQCDPQTAAAASTANRLATEAIERRQDVLSALEKETSKAGAAIPPEPVDKELGQAMAILRRDMETSAALRAKAWPGGQAPPPALEPVLAQAGNLPQLEALKSAAATQGRSGVLLPSALARDLAIEESLINAYFTAARMELERVCLEKPAGANDPFRVPAGPARPAAKSRKGGR